MKQTPLFIITVAFLSLPCAQAAAETGYAAPPQIESVTVEGGPIASKHFQNEDESFRERHGLAVLKIATKDYGNWGLYLLTPNSVDAHLSARAMLPTPSSFLSVRRAWN